MENQNTVEQTNDTTVQQPQLTIADLQNIKQIIDVAAKRGAFNSAEFTAVGITVDRLNAFLVAITPPADASVADSTEESTEENSGEETVEDAPVAEESDSSEEPTA
jgi:hypothetical protein